jgi:hypothetical protein
MAAVVVVLLLLLLLLPLLYLPRYDQPSYLPTYTPFTLHASKQR